MVKQIFLLCIIGISSISAAGSPALQWYFGPSDASSSNGIYGALCNEIKSAKKSIYLAVHELEMTSLAEMLAEKEKSGVNVEAVLEKKWVSDIENRDAYRILTNAGIKVTLDFRSAGLMHNKYAVIDRCKVWTGSVNWTATGFFRNHNNAVVVSNKDIAEHYYSDFLKLANSAWKSPAHIYSIKPDVLDDGTEVTAWFSRSGYSAAEGILQTINYAQRIEFLIFAFSSAEISRAMEIKARAGVRVRGVFDDAFESENTVLVWKEVPFQKLWMAGADVKYDGLKAKLHDKCLIADETVLTGSYNFSKNADLNNNENYLVIKNRAMAQDYRREFNKIYAAAPGKTLYESWRDLQSKSNFAIEYHLYEKSVSKNKYKALKTSIRTGAIEGTLADVYSGDFFELKEKNSGLPVRVKIFGADAYELRGFRDTQGTAAVLGREFLWLKLAGQKITAAVIYENEAGVLHAVCTTADGRNIADDLISKQLALPDEEEKLSNKTGSNETKRLKNIFSAVSNRQFLSESPAEFRKRTRDAALNAAESESQKILGNWQKGCVIANRDTGRWYDTESSIYWEYIKDLSQSKLIFFKNSLDAESCGYVRGKD